MLVITEDELAPEPSEWAVFTKNEFGELQSVLLERAGCLVTATFPTAMEAIRAVAGISRAVPADYVVRSI